MDEAKGRLDDLKTQIAALPKQQTTSATPKVAQPSTPKPKSSGDAAVDKAYAKQKKLQQQQFDALALLRKAQAEYNAVNSQKIAATQAATKDMKQLKGLESGIAPQ